VTSLKNVCVQEVRLPIQLVRCEFQTNHLVCPAIYPFSQLVLPQVQSLKRSSTVIKRLRTVCRCEASRQKTYVLTSLCSERLTIVPLLCQVRFLSPIYHLNVCPATGHVCLGFLSEATWLPTRCVQQVLSALFALLIRPEPEIAADQTLLNTYNQNRTVYEEKARKSAQEAK